MEVLFTKVRTQSTSKLDNQQQAAHTLLAVEATLAEHNTARTPAAYFAVLFSLLSEQAFGEKGQESLRAALIYLLSAVLPEVPPAVLCSKFEPTVSVLGHVFTEDSEAAPVVRAALGCVEALLAVQDAATWTRPVTRQAYQTLLSFAVDPRPKVRRRAQEAVARLLAIRPAGTARRHPGAATTAEFCLRVLNEYSKSDATMAIQALVVAKATASTWAPSTVAPLCQLLLNLPKLNNTFLTVASLEVFETLFGLDRDSQEVTEDAEPAAMPLGRLREVLRAIIQLKPNVHDTRLMPAWLRVISLGFAAYAQADADACMDALPDIFEMIFPNLESDKPSILAASSVALAELVQECIREEKAAQHEAALTRIITLVDEGLGYRYRIAWTGVLAVIEALFKALGRVSLPAMNSTLAALGRLRMEPEFDCKDELDQAIGAAVRGAGIQSVIAELPLNIDEAGRQTGEGRAWLLPVLTDYVANTELRHFVEVMMPLGDALSTQAEKFRAAGREIEWKVLTTLTHQLWHMLVGYLTLPTDAPTYFNGALVQRIIAVMQSEPDLLPPMCTALQVLVEKFQTLRTISESTTTSGPLMLDGEKVYGLDAAAIEAALQAVAAQSKQLLSALFNVYMATATESRGYILQVIQTYLTITSEADVNATYRGVHQLLGQVLAGPNGKSGGNNLPDAGTLLDLAIGMMAQLDTDSLKALLSVAVELLDRTSEPTLQKKAHKVLRRAAASPRGLALWREGYDGISARLLAASEHISAAAKKDRLLALNELVKLMPAQQFNHLPVLLSEAIVCTKEVNERTRDVAYGLLVAMGYRMKEGGTITVPGPDGQTTTTQATLAEYFTMTAAGLAGSTPHMISASIAALSRLLFEFKEDIAQETIDQLLETVHVFIVSGNREVVKSALGLVKVAVITLDASQLQHHLAHLMEALLRWSNDHKGHFKVKVRHIVERLVRKFGYEAIEELMPEKDRKLIVNIKKRRQRAKRRREATGEAGDAEGSDAEATLAQGATARKTGGKVDAYEDALYGSESDLADSDDEANDNLDTDRPSRARQAGKKNSAGKAWIKETGDVPLDFLDENALSHVTGSAPSKRAGRRGADDRQQALRARMANAFSTSADGRMVIGADGEDGASDDRMTSRADAELSDAEPQHDYYLESKQSREGYTRVNNRIRFNKRGTNAEDFGDNDAEPARTHPGKGKGKVADKPMIGHGYRSKRAGGDVKRTGRPDPYAYIPLNPLTLKKRGPRSKLAVSVTGKKQSKAHKRR